LDLPVSLSLVVVVVVVVVVVLCCHIGLDLRPCCCSLLLYRTVLDWTCRLLDSLIARNGVWIPWMIDSFILVEWTGLTPD
jgi:hypothetical protein